MNFRFSGHETFPCRYAWLPKAAQVIAQQEHRDILTSNREDDAMVQLGVGKNMVRSIRFWAESADIIDTTNTGHKLTDFGARVLVGAGKQPALDPYLEDIQTLWLIHWKLSTNQKSLIFAWDFLLSQFQEPEIYASTVHRGFRKAVNQLQSRDVTTGSLEQLYHVFLHSYVPTRGDKGDVREDSLDCPLVELGLLEPNGFTESASHPGRHEPKYVFRREEKPEISHALFAYCLDEFWRSRFATEQSIPLHIIVSGHASPGQVFKIPEADIRTRLLAVKQETNGLLRFEESAAVPRVVRQSNHQHSLSLEEIYRQETAYA